MVAAQLTGNDFQMGCATRSTTHSWGRLQWQKAVLTAIAIPVFTTQLERSREATDLSNIRAAYAEAVAEYLAAGATAEKTATVATIQQQTAGWLLDDGSPKLKTRVNGTEADVSLPDLKTGDSAVVKVAADGTVTVTKGT